jgi:DNA polymerase-3 subunit gamma/tau
VSLYRTWRPKSFADLVGQDAVVRTLRTALSSGKLAHAYLFSGPRGSGKTSAAKILARCIDCVAGPTPEPDNTCENCLAMIAGTALDVIEIDAASNRGIDEIRALRDSAKFAPASMRAKVFIIDEAHMLTREGANAFLKTLEEPPPHVVFILATTAPEALPATILSRCQRYAFRRIPIVVMIARMREIADAEGITIDDGALGAIAYRADGGLRDALTMLEQVASYAGGAVDAATVEAAFGATGREYARALVDAVLAGDAAAALRVVDAASDAGADMQGLTRGAIGEYRNVLVARIDPELLSRDLSDSDAQAAASLARTTPQPKVVRGLRLLADALASGRSSGNPRLELETALLRLIVQAEDPSLEALATRVALLEAGAGAPPPLPVTVGVKRTSRPGETAAARGKPPVDARTTPPTPVAPESRLPVTSEPAPSEPAPSEVAPSVPVASVHEPAAPIVHAPVASEPVVLEPMVPEPASVPDEPIVVTERSATPTLQQVRSLWDQIRLRVEEQNKPLRGVLLRTTVDAVEGNALLLTVPDDTGDWMLRPKIGLVESAVESALGVPLRVVLRNRTASAKAGSPPAVEIAAEQSDVGEVDLMAYARWKIGGAEHG